MIPDSKTRKIVILQILQSQLNIIPFVPCNRNLFVSQFVDINIFNNSS